MNGVIMQIFKKSKITMKNYCCTKDKVFVAKQAFVKNGKNRKVTT